VKAGKRGKRKNIGYDKTIPKVLRPPERDGLFGPGSKDKNTAKKWKSGERSHDMVARVTSKQAIPADLRSSLSGEAGAQGRTEEKNSKRGPFKQWPEGENKELPSLTMF